MALQVFLKSKGERGLEPPPPPPPQELQQGVLPASVATNPNDFKSTGARGTRSSLGGRETTITPLPTQPQVPAHAVTLGQPACTTAGREMVRTPPPSPAANQGIAWAMDPLGGGLEWGESGHPLLASHRHMGRLWSRPDDSATGGYKATGWAAGAK